MLGELLNIGGQYLLNRMDNKAAASRAREANAFTRTMMQSRHQWEVDDLRAAGLNPVLSAGGTPSMGSSAKAEVFSSADSVGRGVSSALEAQRTKAEVKLLTEQAKKATSENFESQYRSGLIRLQQGRQALENKILGAEVPYRDASRGFATGFIDRAHRVLGSSGRAVHETLGAIDRSVRRGYNKAGGK